MLMGIKLVIFEFAGAIVLPGAQTRNLMMRYIRLNSKTDGGASEAIRKERGTCAKSNQRLRFG